MSLEIESKPKRVKVKGGQVRYNSHGDIVIVGLKYALEPEDDGYPTKTYSYSDAKDFLGRELVIYYHVTYLKGKTRSSYSTHQVTKDDILDYFPYVAEAKLTLSK